MHRLDDTFLLKINHPVTSVVITGSWHCNKVVVRSVLVGTGAAKQYDLLCSTPVAASAKALHTMMTAFLNGEHVDFSNVTIDSAHQTQFQKKVLSTLRTLPVGSTCSYSDLAERAGYPHAVRAVASVLRKNKLPIILPCHRVVQKNGKPGGYCGARSGPDAALKETLLQLEQKSRKKCDKN